MIVIGNANMIGTYLEQVLTFKVFDHKRAGFPTFMSVTHACQCNELCH